MACPVESYKLRSSQIHIQRPV